MRIIKVIRCEKCPYRHEEESGGLVGESTWWVCLKKPIPYGYRKIEDQWEPLKGKFPEWCPLKEEQA